MGQLERQATFEGEVYEFVDLVEHTSDDRRIVLCRSARGGLHFMTEDEWERAAPASFVEGSSEEPVRASAPVTTNSSPDEKIELIMSLFRGRTDVYAEGYVGKNTKPGKLGYSPKCSLLWDHALCPKGKKNSFPCSQCKNRTYAPLTKEAVGDHLRGFDKGKRFRAVGIYVVADDICYFLAADFDGPGWQEAAGAYRDACRNHGLTPAVERSRSGNGAHVWVFFEDAVKAALARRVGDGLLSEARKSCTAVSFKSYDRLFPLQDRVTEGDLGSLIALPLNGEAVRRGCSVFVDDSFVQLEDQCAYLSTLPKASVASIERLADEFGKNAMGVRSASDITFVETGARSLALTIASQDASMPAEVKVTLSDGVHIDCEGLPRGLVDRLQRLAVFMNPEFMKRLRQHLSVRNTPRVIDMSRMEGEELVLPRGCTEVALAILREEGVEPLVTDKRVRGKHIHVTFAGELRDSQKPCRDNLVEHDTGVLVAPTGFGKTVIGASIIAAHQVSTLIIVGRVTLAEQWHDSLMKFLEIDEAPPVLLTPTGRKKRHQPDVVGVIGGGKRLASGIVDVAIIDSLLVKGEIEGETIVDPIVHNYGMVIVDEAHHVGSGQYDQVLSAVSSRYVYGMTATPKRSDGHDRAIFLGCGPKRYEVNVKEQIAEQGLRRLLVPRFTTSHPDEVTTKNWVQLVDYICSDENRKFLIVSDAIRALEYGRTVLVLARRVEHARALHKAIKEWGSTLDVQFALLVGKDGSAERKRRLEALRHVSEDRSLCVVATGGLVGEGFDLDRLDCLLLAEPVSFSERLAQWVGRLHRTREGKSDVIVMDYIDPSIPMFDNHWRNRLREYKKLGYEMAKGADLLLVGLKDESHEGGHLVSNSEFSGVFEADLRECSKTVLISATWVKISRVRWLKDALRDAVNRGVAVSIIIKQPSAQDTEWHDVLDILKDAGCSVEVRTDGTVLDYAVFDDTLVWYGMISALAFARKEDCALRFASREVAATLLKAQETGTVVSL